jgi:hypothetical protein
MSSPKAVRARVYELARAVNACAEEQDVDTETWRDALLAVYLLQRLAEAARTDPALTLALEKALAPAVDPG